MKKLLLFLFLFPASLFAQKSIKVDPELIILKIDLPVFEIVHKEPLINLHTACGGIITDSEVIACGHTIPKITPTTIDSEISEPIDESSEINQIVLYPNPAKDIIHLSLESATSFEFTIWSIDGSLIQKGQLAFSNNQTIDVGHLKPGNYILKIHEQDSSFKNLRFVKI